MSVSRSVGARKIMSVSSSVGDRESRSRALLGRERESVSCSVSEGKGNACLLLCFKRERKCQSHILFRKERKPPPLSRSV